MRVVGALTHPLADQWGTHLSYRHSKSGRLANDATSCNLLRFYAS